MHIKVQSFTAIQSRPFCIPQDPLSGTPSRDTGTALDPGAIRLSKLTSGVILERCGTASCRRICCEEPDAILGSLSISATGWMGSKLRRNRKDLTSVAKASYQRWATRTHGCSIRTFPQHVVQGETNMTQASTFLSRVQLVRQNNKQTRPRLQLACE